MGYERRPESSSSSNLTNVDTVSRSSDGTGSGIADENDVDGTSASNNEYDEIPLIIPNILPTLDENDGDDGDDSSDQENSEDGTDGANSEEGNHRAPKANDNNNNDLEISTP
jgi:hypothetical protein